MLSSQNPTGCCKQPSLLNKFIFHCGNLKNTTHLNLHPNSKLLPLCATPAIQRCTAMEESLLGFSRLLHKPGVFFNSSLLWTQSTSRGFLLDGWFSAAEWRSCFTGICQEEPNNVHSNWNKAGKELLPSITPPTSFPCEQTRPVDSPEGTG